MEIACQRSFAMSFSGAFCAGLIEAERGLLYGMQLRDCFPALFAPASLKREAVGGLGGNDGVVFRRFLRRPH